MKISISSEVVTIGCDPSNSVHLDDSTVDCESTSGTLVNGNAVTQACLQHGDRISIGQSQFYFLIDETSELASRAPASLTLNLKAPRCKKSLRRFLSWPRPTVRF
jgi:pSer/pThr/pTyr-binding forkhead associated (FHA) protein